jgi:dTDP-4-amino-4,6-dideoxygalactose transaminase
MSFNIVSLFENKIAELFGSKYAVAVDCCTHGLELALRYTNADRIKVPTHTYLSIPMLADKLNIQRMWKEEEWEKYYYITSNIIDAATLWEADSYVKGTFMVLSFQFKKHLSLGRGGMILTDDIEAWEALKRMSYDGRVPETDEPWAVQDIDSIGYHYYMTPETAHTGIQKLENKEFQDKLGRIWNYQDYPNLMNFKIFKNG